MVVWCKNEAGSQKTFLKKFSKKYWQLTNSVVFYIQIKGNALQHEREVHTMNNNTNIFDNYTDADWDAMYESYLQDKGEQDLPTTYEWGLY